MDYWHDVSLGEKYPAEFHTIVEIPRGSANKYEIDKDTGLIKLDRVNHTAHYYPFDYGFIPQTYWHDEDPLDVVLLTTSPLAPGILVECRAIGVIEMIDGGESDNKIIAVPVEDPRFEEYQDLGDIESHKLKEAKHFFETYKDLQNKKVEVTAINGKKEAIACLEEGKKLYDEKFKK